ncbi:hypothetical protein ABTX81_23020 [Kitasatospora sp. NPDC097605]|uniref:hypothetical protein n=1 Tax=Kitasatospora sp. NPDC097605 TaxID=3157226 RepID=UPI0033210687
MTDPDDGTREPRDPPVRRETPESRMTGEGGPPPSHEEDKGPADGPEYAVTAPEDGEPGREPPPDRTAGEPGPYEPPDRPAGGPPPYEPPD